MNGPFVKLLRRMISRIIQSVFAPAVGAAIARAWRNGAILHLDQGIAVTSHASQAKTVDQVIVSVPVRSFSQANEAQSGRGLRGRAREAGAEGAHRARATWPQGTIGVGPRSIVR